MIDKYMELFQSFIEKNGPLISIIISLAALVAAVYIVPIVLPRRKKRKEYEKERDITIDNLLNNLSVKNADGDNLTKKLITSPDFIPNMGLTDSPNNLNLEEFWKLGKIINKENKEVKRFPLVDTLLQEMLSNKNSLVKKHYIILGGSGIGKTTFLASFIYNYYCNNRFISEKSFEKPPYQIYLFKLSSSNTLDNLRSLNDRNSILLLEALDENKEASENVGRYLKRLLPIISEFKFVIITCRTQLFKDKEDEVNQIIENQEEENYVPYTFYYISPFIQKEALKFIDNKFKKDNEKLRKAKEIMEQSGDVMARPLVLTYIDDILDINTLRVKLADTDIYMAIIEKWIRRECVKEKENDIKEWYKLSKKVALRIYEKWLNSEDDPKISNEEFNQYMKKCGLGKNTKPHVFSQRSLLNRDDKGNIKFSHRSFWEIFLAICSIENPSMNINPAGLTLAAKFSKELFQFQMNGEKFSYINYYKPSTESLDLKILSSFDDSVLPEYLEKCKGKINSIKSNIIAFRGVVYELLLLLLQRFTYQRIVDISIDNCINGYIREENGETTKINILRKAIQNSFPKQKSIFLLQSLFLNVNIHEESKVKEILEYVRILLKSTIVTNKTIDSNISLKDMFDTESLLILRDTFKDNPELSNIGYLQQQNSNFRIDNYDKNKDYIVFPYVYALTLINPKTAIPKYLVNLGTSLYDNDSIVYAISNLLEDKLRYTTICVYKDIKDTNEILSLIRKISSNEKVRNKLSEQLILMRITINRKTIYYSITQESIDYPDSVVKEIIDNMLYVVNKYKTPNIIHNEVKLKQRTKK